MSRPISTPADVVWDLLVDLERWPQWGPTVRSAHTDERPFGLGTTGIVTTLLGVRLPFEVDSFEPGRSWSWRVAGIPATDHNVFADGAGGCRVRIGVPLLAWPYLAVCRTALRRIERLAVGAHSP